MTDHPIEVARRALCEAALMEGPPYRDALVRIADALPPRAPIPEGFRNPSNVVTLKR